MNYQKLALTLHKKYKGKLEVKSKVPLKTRDHLSAAYTPGVAAVCKLIEKDKRALFTHSIKANTVAVVTDGSAVLGLGNIGPEAALPVMEGKAILFKEFAGVDAFPICLDTQNVDEIVATVKAISIGFGGINLEDISAPRCFAVEERLKKELSIPVFHDDQHGTAIIVLAALTNALRVVKKELDRVQIVISGAGAAAMAITHMLIGAGADAKKIIMVDSTGPLSSARTDLNPYKKEIARLTNGRHVTTSLADALVDADVFIGVSVANILQSAWVMTMAQKTIVFAMANPNPEIAPSLAAKLPIAVFGTGRSDLPNQINNVLAFPGIFRGAFDAHATAITEPMKLAAARAIAGLVPSSKLRAQYIIPQALDRRVAPTVARAVMRAWKK